MRSKSSLKCTSLFLGTFLKSYFNVTNWLDLFITISDTIWKKNRISTFYYCHYWTLQCKILVTRTFFSFSSDIAVSPVCAHPLKKKKRISKRPLSSIIDRCLFWFTGLASLYVRNISGPERCVMVGRWWKQVCHKHREWHIRHACQDD